MKPVLGTLVLLFCAHGFAAPVTFQNGSDAKHVFRVYGPDNSSYNAEAIFYLAPGQMHTFDLAITEGEYHVYLDGESINNFGVLESTQAHRQYIVFSDSTSGHGYGSTWTAGVMRAEYTSMNGSWSSPPGGSAAGMSVEDQLQIFGLGFGFAGIVFLARAGLRQFKRIPADFST